MTALCATLSANFRPRPFATVLMLVLVAVFLRLGQWQWDKATLKTATQSQLDTRGSEAVMQLPASIVANPADYHYRRITATGRYRPQGQILLDNQVHQEQAGYRVITPFVLESSGIEVLVDRGWVAAPMDRQRLPAVPVSDDLRTLSGIAFLPSRKHFTLAADTAPAGNNARWQIVDFERYQSLSSKPLQPLLVRLDPQAADGYLRVWPRPDQQQERNFGYAYQWFGFAASSVLIWLWSCWRKPA